MTWWIAFTIAVVGWYFTATQNAKNSSRLLINQEIKEARTKLHELIVLCSNYECNLPLESTGGEFIKMHAYFVSIQELDRLYASYHLAYFKYIRVVSVPYIALKKLAEHNNLRKLKKLIKYWFLHQPTSANRNQYVDFNVSMHVFTIRQSLTDDSKSEDKSVRLAQLHLQYKILCLKYQFVS